MPRYTIGIDYGTLSARAVLADIHCGQILAQSEFIYPHSVIKTSLQGVTPLGLDWALQHPQDYLDSLKSLIPDLLRSSGVHPEDVIGIGTDVTASTVFPIRSDGTPLCFLPEFEGHPNAYIKLWKHQAAQDKADKITSLASAWKVEWLQYFGGKVSATWLLPKVLELLEQDQKLYMAMDHYIEASDWIVLQLCGVLSRNACAAGYKSMYNRLDGYPARSFLKALNPGLENLNEEKLSGPILPVGSCAGGLTKDMATILGLSEGTAIAAGMVDAHACLLAAGITNPSEMLSILGTSGCHIVLDKVKVPIPGICGAVEDGILSGFTSYEAGQVCYGEHFEWLAEHFIPPEYHLEMKAKKFSMHELMSEKASKLKPGESGLLALDWWNGNRSVLIDSDLTGLIVGFTLQTRAEDVYLALLEATAFGVRLIIDNFRKHDVEVDSLCAMGGISQKSPLAMQVLANVLNMIIRVPKTTQGSALGSAILGAVAAGNETGGYDDLFEAVKQMSSKENVFFYPNEECTEIYDSLYHEYQQLYDYFGRGENDVMKRLKEIRREALHN